MYTVNVIPHFVDSSALINTRFMQKNTNLCAEVSELSSEYVLAFDYKTFLGSANVEATLRNYMYDVITRGADLQPQTILYHVRRIENLPQNFKNNIVSEIDLAFRTATSGSVGGDSLASKISNLLLALKLVCNYFESISDAIAMMALIQQSDTPNAAPPWTNEYIPPPRYVPDVSYTKISTGAQNLVTTASYATRAVTNTGVSSIVSGRISTEDSLLKQKTGMSFTSHGEYLVSDTFPYFITAENAASILKQIEDLLGDCFRLYDYKYTYNPLDEEMNKAVAVNQHTTVYSEKATHTLNIFGKPKVPTTKPDKMSIKDFLDYKESNYEYDDEENRNRYPETGKQTTTDS